MNILFTDVINISNISAYRILKITVRVNLLITFTTTARVNVD